MKTTNELISTLDQKAVEVLKRKLLAGEISPEMFKGILKRQMIKQQEQVQSNWFRNAIKTFFRNMGGTLQNSRGAVRIKSQTKAAPSLSIEEMLSLARRRRI